MYFKKLKGSFVIENYTVNSFFRFYGNAVDGIKRGLSYFTVENYGLGHLLSVIPERYRNDDFSLSLMSINANFVPPHTDSNILTSINFYLQTDRCLTRFYDPKVKELSTYQLENQTTGYIFRESELIEVGNFLADPGDAYLLDVSKPHSVINSQKIEIDRKAIVIQSRKYDFEAVREMLIETGYL